MNYPVYGGNGIVGTTNSFLVEPSTVIIGRVGANCGCVHITNQKSFVTDNALIVTIKTSYLEPLYLSLFIQSINFKKIISSTAQPLISGQKIYPILMRIPSLKEQNSIIKKLDQFFDLI